MTSRPGASQDEMRRHNVSTVLWQVHVHGALSRAELTSLMGLNRSTIKGLVAELAGAGLVAETIPDTRTGAGRPSHVVVPRLDGPYVLASYLSVDSVQVAAVGLGGVVLARREYRSGGVGAKPDVVAGRLVTELRRLQRQVPAGAWLVGVGVGLPGVVRRADGHVEFAPNLTWTQVPFGRLLADRLGLAVPVRVANDGDLGALAEHVRGAGRGVDNLIFIAGEVGIGGGLVVDGRMVSGTGGYAGEIGHMMINPAGRRCRCGAVGCLETEVGEEALLLAAGRPPHGGRAAHRRVIEAARRGSPVEAEAVRSVGRWLGRGLATLVNVFNPELVILGGPLSEVFLVAEEEVCAELAALALQSSRQQVRLTVPEHGADASLFGAAELAFEGLLEHPCDEAWARIS